MGSNTHQPKSKPRSRWWSRQHRWTATRLLSQVRHLCHCNNSGLTESSCQNLSPYWNETKSSNMPEWWDRAKSQKLEWRKFSSCWFWKFPGCSHQTTWTEGSRGNTSPWERRAWLGWQWLVFAGTKKQFLTCLKVFLWSRQSSHIKMKQSTDQTLSLKGIRLTFSPELFQAMTCLGGNSKSLKWLLFFSIKLTLTWLSLS